MFDEKLVREALPGYEIQGEIGRGLWGVVLRARHQQLGRDVAIKQLPRALGGDPAVRSRFVREARALSALDHPHVVRVFDFVEHENLCLLVMELLPGGTLMDREAVGGLTLPEACSVGLAASAGLGFAHDAGILHRDVKPQNLLFGSNDVLKVADFGIAKIVGGSSSVATAAGHVLGSPAYMAPEQVTGETLTAACDVYSLATTLYEMMSGHLPFGGSRSTIEMLTVRIDETPVHLAEVGPVPDPIADVIMRGLAARPDDRYSTAGEFATALAHAATESLGLGWALRSAERSTCPRKCSSR